MVIIEQEQTLPHELGDYLVRQGKLDRAGFDRAERLRHSSDEKFVVILSKLGLVPEIDVATALSALLKIKLVQGEDYPEVAIAADRISHNFLRASRAVPVSEADETITLAMVDPSEQYVRSSLELITGKTVEVVVGIPSEVDAAIDRLYGETQGDEKGKDATGALSLVEPSQDDIERLKDIASEAPVVRKVSQMIEQAVIRKASDIHMEPSEDGLKIRYRVDGTLVDVETAAKNLRSAIISRIKILARLNIAEQRLPQDGRMQANIRGHDVDFRVSTVPTVHGERVVLRVLDRSATPLDFGALGLSGKVLDDFLELLEKPNGIVLVTGPTGSGKTSTLYTSLQHLNRGDTNILTVEDPVEFELEGINQVNTKSDIGLNFAHVLRSFLRQDPDIIMVGEIRDIETAQIAVQAALTGHLVLSTLHTNNAVSTITRLLDMGLEDYLLTSTINGVVAQRLVRTLCHECREEYEPLPELIDQLSLPVDGSASNVSLWKSKGCDACNHTGYAGRTSIMEVLPLTEELRKLVLSNADLDEMTRAALAAGMQPLYQAGARKALEGVTSIEEVLRVTGGAGK